VDKGLEPRVRLTDDLALLDCERKRLLLGEFFHSVGALALSDTVEQLTE